MVIFVYLFILDFFGLIVLEELVEIVLEMLQVRVRAQSTRPGILSLLLPYLGIGALRSLAFSSKFLLVSLK